MRVTDGLLRARYPFRMTRIGIVFILALLAAPAVWAEPGAQQQPCRAGDTCDSGLSCVKRSDGKSTCEKRCKSGSDCPEEQRCVKDGGQSVCRPAINI